MEELSTAEKTNKVRGGTALRRSDEWVQSLGSRLQEKVGGSKEGGREEMNHSQELLIDSLKSSSCSSEMPGDEQGERGKEEANKPNGFKLLKANRHATLAHKSSLTRSSCFINSLPSSPLSAPPSALVLFLLPLIMLSQRPSISKGDSLQQQGERSALARPLPHSLASSPSFRGRDQVQQGLISLSSPSPFLSHSSQDKTGNLS